MIKSERKIAMTDIESTGLIPGMHEILEIGLVVFDQNTFEIVDTLNIKTKPLHIENAMPESLVVNGYQAENWTKAVSLKEAIEIYAEKTKDAVFCAYNATFDWSFINDAFIKTGVPNPLITKENHDRLDLLSIAFAKGLNKSESLSLRSACEMFGVPKEPLPHTAMNGAMTDYELFKKLYSS